MRAERAALDQFDVNGRYPCWYDPANPEKVVVVRGHAWFTWLLLAGTVAVVAVGIGSPTGNGPTRLLAGRARPNRRSRHRSQLRAPAAWTATPDRRLLQFRDAPALPAGTPGARGGDHWEDLYRGLADLPVGAALMALAWWGPVTGRGVLVMAAFGLALAALACAISRKVETHVFDRHQGVYRRSAPFRRAQRTPLASVLAVQILTDLPREEKGSEGWPTQRFRAHQLNLVLVDPGAPRQNLLDQGDKAATVQVGHGLAEFLGVPLYGGA